MYGFTRCATRNNNIKNTTPTNNIITNDRRTDRPQSYQSAERYDSTNTITEDDGATTPGAAKKDVFTLY